MALVLGCSVLGCSGGDQGSDTTQDADVDAAFDGARDDTTLDGDAPHDAPNADVDAKADATTDAAPTPCTTTVYYGSAWIHGPSHPDAFDVATGNVSWDGVCTDDGANSFAVLSNGWKPYFTGNGACVIALQHAGDTDGCPHAACSTRITYGSSWLPPPGHAGSFDDVAGVAFGDGACHDQGTNSYADLSNGWQPHFSGHGACRLSFRYEECGALYANPVIPFDCPDPGVIDGWYLACTSGGAPDAYPIFTSSDLASWSPKGHIFPSADKPTWATGDFWAPEIHHVGSKFIAYFSARNSDGKLSIGAASASAPTGPFTDIGHPLVHDGSMGLIDASEINATDGTPYLLWKEDGNAVGKPTPIHAQPLATDGLSLVGAPSTLITNDLAWEGALVEGPWMIAHGGEYFLFYSANAYYDGRYAVGVARAPSPTGPFTKHGAPILVTGGAWVGPGHCSVVLTPAGETVIVYHAWHAGCVNTPGCGREVLIDRVDWGADGWPFIPLAPSSTSRPVP
jgi:GH43 family beta-xylosidase